MMPTSNLEKNIYFYVGLKKLSFMPGETVHIIFDNYDDIEERYILKEMNESDQKRDMTNLS